MKKILLLLCIMMISASLFPQFLKNISGQSVVKCGEKYTYYLNYDAPPAENTKITLHCSRGLFDSAKGQSTKEIKVSYIGAEFFEVYWQKDEFTDGSITATSGGKSIKLSNVHGEKNNPSTATSDTKYSIEKNEGRDILTVRRY